MEPPGSPPTHRLETAAAILACAVAAVWIDLGRIHRMENGDSLLPVLISLHHWTPFMWDQDRFGMLMPLIARPFRDPVVNLLVQRGAFLFAGLCSFLAVSRWAFGPGRRWQLAGLCAAALFLALAPAPLSFGYLGDEPYAPSLLLGACALLVLEAPGRRALRLPLVALLVGAAHWVNAGLFVLMAPAAVLRGAALAAAAGPGARPGELRGGLRQCAWVLSGAAVGWGLNRAGLGTRSTRLNPTPPSDWPEGWALLAQNLWKDLAPHGLVWAALALGAAGAALLAISRRRGERTPEWAFICAALLAAGVAYFLALGAHSWIQYNGYLGRYVEPALPLFVLGLIGLLLVPLSSALGARAFRLACFAAAVAVVGAGALAFGAPAPSKIREDLAALSPAAEEVVGQECTHVIGNYWTVWPVVFQANAMLYERGEARIVWGLTERARPTLGLSLAVPPERLRIAAPLGDEEVERWRAELKLPALVEVSRGSRIAVLAPAEAAR